MDFRNPRFFNTTVQKGENYELRIELNSEYRERRKEAVKKVIANMTVGKDVSGLFADVVKNMQTEDLELKKLVYLYLINYAKSQPELVILAVNTFVKDSDDHNPLIRALAIRTMGCLRVEKITAYILEPLKKGLADQDPYVRKTAALCVAKFYDLNPAVALDNGLVAILQEMLADRNPMVIANAVAALTEINEATPNRDVFQVNNVILTKLLAAINECTEWGQISILSSLSEYKPVDAREAADIVEKVVPRLQHANPSVVLSAVKVIMVYFGYIIDSEVLQLLNKKLAPSLVTLLSSEPEIQYVVLRNINLILQKKPDVLSQDMRVFFTKYNDPLYVKLEKLEVIVKLSSESNIDSVLSELREYANEVDVHFVRKAVRAIGRCAIKIESAADKCIQVLLELLKTGVNYIIQESIIITRDIFRKYPHQYEGIIPALCENLESLDGSEAKAALIWIIGEYSERIDNASELLEYFLETFKEESSAVQLQLITASVKHFLKKPEGAQDLVQRILNTATQGNENPDIRDRAYVYWRLLSTSPQASKTTVLLEKPSIQFDNNAVNDQLLDELIANISNLASVYCKPVSQVGKPAFVERDVTDQDDGELLEGVPIQAVVQEAAKALGSSVGDLLDLDMGGQSSSSSSHATPKATANIEDLLGSVDMDSSPAMQVSLPGSPAGMLPSFSMVPSFSLPKSVYLVDSESGGLLLEGTFLRKYGQIFIDFEFENKSKTPMSDFAIQFNFNSFGLTPQAPLAVPSPLLPQIKTNVQLALVPSGSPQKMEPLNILQVAIKNNNGVYYYQTTVPLWVLLDERFTLNSASFEACWADVTLSHLDFELKVADDNYSSKLSKNGINTLESNKLYANTINGTLLLVQTEKTGEKVKFTVKSHVPELLPLFKESVEILLAE